MLKNRENSNTGRKKPADYRKRAPLAALLLLSLFFAEIVALYRNSAVSVSTNEEVAYYQNKIEAAMDKKNIVTGDILDRDGNPIVSFSGLIADDSGTYSDPYLYSTVVGYCKDEGGFGILGKYQTLMRTTANESDEKGYSLKLTLDAGLSKAVYEALKETIGEKGRGSMVVMDADTGEILAFVSTPVFDASDISKEILWMNEKETSNGVWYPLAKVGDIAPGSTAKLITSIAMIENGMVDYTTTDDTVFEGDGYTISNYASYRSSGGEIGITEALRKSSNVYFVRAVLSMENAREKLTKVAKKLYLGDNLNLDFGTVISNWTYDEDTWEEILQKKYFNEERELATTAFGQSEVRMSGLQGAMLAAGIINGGKIMTPYMIETAIDANGGITDITDLLEESNKKAAFAADSDAAALTAEAGNAGYDAGIEAPVAKKNTVLSELTDTATASKVSAMMKNAAVRQYGFEESLGVLAKSGTSETGNFGDSGNNAWMVSACEINGHKYAIAINWANAKEGTQGKDMKKPVETIYHYLQEQN